MKKKKKIHLSQLHRIWDWEGHVRDQRRSKRIADLESDREGENDTGLRRWANSIGHLRAEKQLPF